MEEMLISNPLSGFLSNLALRKDGECIQLDCQKKLEEELKTIWAQAVLSDIPLLDQPSFKSRALRSLRSPFSHSGPIIEVLSYLLAKKLGRLTPPLIPRYACLPLFELCQLALLWSIAGFSREASSLAHSIFPLLDFPFLWCREEEYNEVESNISIALFRKKFSPTSQVPPFFGAINKLFSGFDVPCSVALFSPQTLFFHSTDTQGALSLLGRRTSLGTFRSKDIEVRAFGPQILPLNDPKGFGIERTLSGDDGWTQISALPEVWLQVKYFFENGLDLRFLGLSVETPLNFSFYIKAPQAQIGPSQFLPKSLARYQGMSRPVLFGKTFQIQSTFSTKMELIPLAGEGCFWGAEFLLSFEIPPFEAKSVFKWNLSE